jgi:photosystem II stability/assembly factor-like uncharacterized protein
LFVFSLTLTLPSFGAVSAWVPFGPDGGDARRIVVDPRDANHLFLGTANGWLYESHNDGGNWQRLARVESRDDLAVDSIVVDPRDSSRLVIGAWAIDHSDGGIFLSSDGGRTFTSQDEMRRQNVLAMASTPANPDILVAGTLQGVFRSVDFGRHWTRISPADSVEIHNIQSVAIDPKDPNVIYAGTWHLPYKTTDAGEHWANMKTGIIDDSDVFSIIVDPTKPEVVYASACSGIYKSENAGIQFHKIQGIPSTARRTRRLLQDPNNLDIVFAGTTEGLFRSLDAGKTWSRTTGPEIIVNDVEIDPKDSKRVLIATDRGGVMASADGGNTFRSANNGFSARQVTALERDRSQPNTMFIGVVNDKDWGGVFESDNAGVNWIQRSAGLQGRDVFALGETADGTLIAGTSHGLFRLDRTNEVWNRVESAPPAPATAEAARAQASGARPPVPVGRDQQRSAAATRTATTKTNTAARAKAKHLTPAQQHAAALAAKRRAATQKKSAASSTVVVAGEALPAAELRKAAPRTLSRSFDGSVYALAASGKTMLASTSIGLLESDDNGQNWLLAGPEGAADWRFLATAKNFVIGASLRGASISQDQGATWAEVRLPPGLSQISAVAVEPTGAMWIAGREGVYVTTDGGANWETPKNLFLTSVNNIYYDDQSDRMVVTTLGPSSYVFTVQLPSRKVSFSNSGWSLRMARPVGDHLVAATLFDGIVVQPGMMTSPLTNANLSTAPTEQRVAAKR